MTALFHWKVTNGYKVALISRQRHTQSFADMGCSRLYSISRCSLFLWLPIRQTALPACGQIRLEHQCCRLMGQQARPRVHCFYHSSTLNVLSRAITDMSCWSRPWPWAWETEVLLPRPAHEETVNSQRFVWPAEDLAEHKESHFAVFPPHSCE